MHAKEILILGQGSAAVAVDAAKPFAIPGHLFEQAYGRKDIQPILDVVDVMREAVTVWKGMTHLILNISKYEVGQFPEPKLEYLCTDIGEWGGRESLIDPRIFDETIEKTKNSLLSAGERVMDLLNEMHTLIIMGVTTTSCVQSTINEIHALAHQVSFAMPKIILPKDAVASRVSRQEDEAEFFRKWSEDRERIIVVDSWRDIEFV